MSTSIGVTPLCIPADSPNNRCRSSDEAQHETSSDPAFEPTPLGAGGACLPHQLHGLGSALDSCHRQNDMTPGLQRGNFSHFRQGFADTILERMRSRADTSLVTEDLQPDENHEKLCKSLIASYHLANQVHCSDHPTFLTLSVAREHSTVADGGAGQNG